MNTCATIFLAGLILTAAATAGEAKLLVSVRGEKIRSDAAPGVGLSASYAWELAANQRLEASLGAGVSMLSRMASQEPDPGAGSGEVSTGDTKSWTTVAVGVKFVHGVFRADFFEVLYGVGGGWAFIKGRTETEFAGGTSIVPLDHSSPFVSLDARLRVHFGSDRFFLELQPVSGYAGFDYLGIDPKLGLGVRF